MVPDGMMDGSSIYEKYSGNPATDRTTEAFGGSSGSSGSGSRGPTSSGSTPSGSGVSETEQMRRDQQSEGRDYSGSTQQAADDYGRAVENSGGTVHEYAQATREPQRTSNTGSGSYGTTTSNDSVSANDANDPRNGLYARGGLVSRPPKKKK